MLRIKLLTFESECWKVRCTHHVTNYNEVIWSVHITHVPWNKASCICICMLLLAKTQDPSYSAASPLKNGSYL